MKPDRAPGLIAFLCLLFPTRSLCLDLFFPPHSSLSFCLQSLLSFISPFPYVSSSESFCVPLRMSCVSYSTFLLSSTSLSLFSYTSLLPHECHSGSHICFPVSSSLSTHTSLFPDTSLPPWPPCSSSFSPSSLPPLPCVIHLYHFFAWNCPALWT